MEDEGWIEGSVGEVDLRECVVEASEGVAQESAGGFGEETVFGFQLNMMAVRWVGEVRFAEDCDDDQVEYEVPVRFEFFTLYYVELALDVVTSVHPAEDLLVGSRCH